MTTLRTINNFDLAEEMAFDVMDGKEKEMNVLIHYNNGSRDINHTLNAKALIQLALLSNGTLESLTISVDEIAMSVSYGYEKMFNVALEAVCGVSYDMGMYDMVNEHIENVEMKLEELSDDSDIDEEEYREISDVYNVILSTLGTLLNKIWDNSVIDEIKGTNNVVVTDEDILADAIEEDSCELREMLDEVKAKYESALEELNIVKERNAKLQEKVNEIRKVQKEQYRKYRTALERKDNEIEELKSKIYKEEEEMATTEYKEVLKNELEDIAKSIAEEEVISEEEVSFFNKVVESISKRNTKAIATILNASYENVADVMLDSARNGLSKYMLKSKKQKDVTEEIHAFGKVNAWIEEKKASFDEFMETEHENKLVEFGKVLISLFVRALKLLVSASKIVGKTAIAITTLVAKVSVYTITETVKCGKGIFVIVKNEVTAK